MNKQFMIVNGQVIVATENGFREPIPYTDNIEDILLFENEIEYLRRCLATDEKKYDEKNNERIYRNKDSKKISIVGSIIGIGAVFGVSQLVGLSHEEIVDTVMGPMSEYLAFSIPMSVGCIGFVQMISLLGLSYRPSKKILSCYDERIEFEKEMIELLNDELERLKQNVTSKNILQYKEMVSYPVRDEGSLKYLQDSISLRDMYGYDPVKIMSLYYRDELSFVLKNKGYDDNSIMDFLSYLDSEVRQKDIEELKKK